jgi:hypothetical protein
MGFKQNGYKTVLSFTRFPCAELSNALSFENLNTTLPVLWVQI